MILARVVRCAAGRMLAWMLLMAGKQLSQLPSLAGAHGGADGADVAMDCSDGRPRPTERALLIITPLPLSFSITCFFNQINDRVSRYNVPHNCPKR